jgi:hypothetical protein
VTTVARRSIPYVMLLRIPAKWRCKVDARLGPTARSALVVTRALLLQVAGSPSLPAPSESRGGGIFLVVILGHGGIGLVPKSCLARRRSQTIPSNMVAVGDPQGVFVE